jgi:hypothetical protein
MKILLTMSHVKAVSKDPILPDHDLKDNDAHPDANCKFKNNELS